MNFKSLEEQIRYLQIELAELQQEQHDREHAPWHIFIFRETGLKPHALAVVTGRTVAEAREILEKVINDECITYDQSELQLISCFTVLEREVPPTPIASIAIPDKDVYLPF